MRTSFVLLLSFAFAFGISCKKQHSNSGPGGRTVNALGTPVQGTLLDKEVDAWVDGSRTGGDK